MKKILAMLVLLSSLSACFADDSKWSCSVKDMIGGTTYVRNGASREIAKKKAQDKCHEISSHRACKLRGCSQTEYMSNI